MYFPELWFFIRCFPNWNGLIYEMDRNSLATR